MRGCANEWGGYAVVGAWVWGEWEWRWWGVGGQGSSVAGDAGSGVKRPRVGGW